LTSLALETRKRQHVANQHNTSQVIPGEILAATDLRTRYITSTHRPTPVCYTYNCHGLTFAGRRTQITSSVEVRKILDDDDYQIIQQNAVLPGDIVIYISQESEIEHSGIVVFFDQQLIGGAIRVLSKWGGAHEVIHSLMECPYNDMRVEFYRVMK
jgi:hypothetical protein